MTRQVQHGWTRAAGSPVCGQGTLLWRPQLEVAERDEVGESLECGSRLLQAVRRSLWVWGWGQCEAMLPWVRVSPGKGGPGGLHPALDKPGFLGSPGDGDTICWKKSQGLPWPPGVPTALLSGARLALCFVPTWRSC